MLLSDLEGPDMRVAKILTPRRQHWRGLNNPGVFVGVLCTGRNDFSIGSVRDAFQFEKGFLSLLEGLKLTRVRIKLTRQ